MIKAIPDNFDVRTIADDSKLPQDAVTALRELAFRRMSKDFVFFVEKFWFVMNPKTFKWESFILRDYQHEDANWIAALAKKERGRAVILKARQIGMTTLVSAYAFWDCFFHDNHPWLIASQGEDEAKATLLTKIKQPYARLPLWVRNHPSAPAVTDDNKEMMSFDNGSVIESIPSTAASGRSKIAFGALLDEKAFVLDGDALFGAIDPLCYGPLFEFSTANGMGNSFHGTWIEAQAPDTLWESRFHPWFVVPERGPFFKDENGKVTSKWYQRELRKFRGKEWLFYQENPADPQEAFAKSGRTVIPIDLLPEMPEPIRRIDLGRVDLSIPWQKNPLPESDPVWPADEELWVWSDPHVMRDERNRTIQKPNYVVGVDIAEGLEHGDRTSIWVVDANTGVQVAGYRGHWPVEDLGMLCAWIGYAYHTALIIPERNNQGILPITDLQRMSYPRMYRMQALAQVITGDRTPRYGWKTTAGSKPKMVNELIDGIRRNVFEIVDQRFVQEAMTFVADGKGGYAASGQNYDDHVMGAAIAWQGVLDVGQYPIMWIDDEDERITMGLIRRRAEGPKETGIGVKPQRPPVKSFVI